MRIIYCHRYKQYAGQQHCEFFNEGDGCVYHDPAHWWRSIKDLLLDNDRPLWDVASIIKPFNCNLMDLLHLNTFSARSRYGEAPAGSQG